MLEPICLYFSQAERKSGFRSTMTRDGTTSFEIEVPSAGVTCKVVLCLQVLTLAALVGADRCNLFGLLIIPLLMLAFDMMVFVIVVRDDGWYPDPDSTSFCDV